MNDEKRADPDELLRRVHAEEARARRGRLKIFFGAAPGVGKTYAMLEAALGAKAEGRDVVVGYVETHGRVDTEKLAEGLETLPRKSVEYRGKRLWELDIDAALRRKPAVLLVDELAHTNAPGSRHPKRWQDVVELIEAGLEVWTTLNVQHIESLNDVISQITGVRVRETLPDRIVELADEMELVDLPPEALLERLREGKVYGEEAARRAEVRFFRKGNLLALRELALRKTAERVDTDVLAWRREQGIEAAWPTMEHILVCIGPSPASADLVRAARRMAAGLRARWTAATVETPTTARLSEENRARVSAHLRLAEELGATVATLSGERPSEAILSFSRDHNVTRIILGKPTHSRLSDFVVGSVLDEVVRGSGAIDVHVIAGEPPSERGAPRLREARTHDAPPHYAWGAMCAAAATLVALPMRDRLGMTDPAMVYILAVVFVAYRFGRGPGLVTSALSVALFDFCFVPPYYTFSVDEAKHIITFAGLFLVGLVTSGLAERVRRQAEAARTREARTATLYALARELSRSQDAAEIAACATRHVIAAGAARQVVVLLSRPDAPLAVVASSPPKMVLPERERAVVAWAIEHAEPAGKGTSTLPAADGLYLPLTSAGRCLGVLGLFDGERFEDIEQRNLLDAFSHQIATALRRAELEKEARAAFLRAERESLRNTLLGSVSHDLRTPLAAITGAASTLLEKDSQVAGASKELLETIVDEASRLNRLVGNLLDMTRLESGGLEIHAEWTPLEEVVGAALHRLGKLLEGRAVHVSLPNDLPLVRVDGVLLGQVFFNLLDNAVKYTPPESPLDIAAYVRNGASGEELVIDVADRGAGLSDVDKARVFEKFVRGHGASRASGTGLGLAICRGIVGAHGGTIEAVDRPGGGSIFRVVLPRRGEPPPLPEEPPEAA